MMDRENLATYPSFSVKSDVWNTLWLIQKTVREGQKKETPVHVEIETGSVEVVVSFLEQVLNQPVVASTIGGIIGAIATWILTRKENDNPIEVTGINREAAYSLAINHLNTQAQCTGGRIIRERTLPNGHFFEIRDDYGNSHRYWITDGFQIRYDALPD